MRFSRLPATLLCLVALAAPLSAQGDKALAGLKDGLYAVLETDLGPITVELYYKSAPLACANLIGLAEGSYQQSGKPYYDGITFHRVEPGFVVQTGDPTGTGRGGPGYQFPNEIDASLSYDSAGVLGMANAGKDTNGSQFFITLSAAPRLDGSYTIFGKVVRGLDVLNSLRKGSGLRTVRVARIGEAANAFRMSKAQFDEAIAKHAADAKRRSLAALADQYVLVRQRFPKLLEGASGILYQTVRAGNGTKPAARTKVSVYYTLTDAKGRSIDSNVGSGRPMQFTLAAQEMIPGFDLAVADMSYGEKRVVVLPPELAYGERGAGGAVPPNAVLVFEIELLVP